MEGIIAQRLKSGVYSVVSTNVADSTASIDLATHAVGPSIDRELPRMDMRKELIR